MATVELSPERQKKLEILYLLVSGFMSSRFGDGDESLGKDTEVDVVFAALYQVAETGESSLTYHQARSWDVAHLDAYYKSMGIEDGIDGI